MIGANLNSVPLNCGTWIRDQAHCVWLTVYGATASSSDPAGDVRRTFQALGDGQFQTYLEFSSRQATKI